MNIPVRRLTKGFTLIELLVVIAIISLLAAIMFPVFARARENARRSNCQNNLKMLGLAFIQYAQDYDERMPSGSYPETGDPNPPENWRSYALGMGWAGQLLPYVKNVQVFMCPSDLGRPKNIPPAGTKYWTYRLNANVIFKDRDTDDLSEVLKLSQFNASPRTVLLNEITGSYYSLVPGEDSSPTGNGRIISPVESRTYSNCTAMTTTSSVLSTAGIRNVPSFSYTNGDIRHLEGSNYLAADGHVKWLKPSSVSIGMRAWYQKASFKECYYGGTANVYAEGTEYNGDDAHVLTYNTY